LVQLGNLVLLVKTKITKLVLLLLHKQAKTELEQTLLTNKVKVLQKLLELKLIKLMLHKLILAQILLVKITKLLELHKALKLVIQKMALIQLLNQVLLVKIIKVLKLNLAQLKQVQVKIQEQQVHQLHLKLAIKMQELL